jgi:5-methyltetrahydropteroyltriglutamate--homocysteine methyltransferase
MIASALGSYPRIGEGAEAQRLRRAIQKFQAGGLTRDELRAVEDGVTAEVLGEQAAAGVDWVTDGLVRWEDGQTHFTDRLHGFRRGQLLRYFDTNTYYRQPVAVGPVRWQGPIAIEDFRFAAAHSTQPVRPVVTGPYTLARLCADEHYHDLEAFALDLARALNTELRGLEAAGATMLQVDEPALTWHPEDEPLARRLLAQLVGGVTVPVWVALYLGPVTPLLDRVAEWPVAGVWLDCVTEPAAVARLAARPPAEPLRLGLGVVDARNTRLEEAAALSATLARVAERAGADRVAATTSAGLEFLPRQRAREKLARLAEAARLAGAAVSGKGA